MDVDRMITRDELIEELACLGYAIKPRTLMSWEASGLLPRPLRKWRDKRPRALYPPEHAQIVAAVARTRPGFGMYVKDASSVISKGVR